MVKFNLGFTIGLFLGIFIMALSVIITEKSNEYYPFYNKKARIELIKTGHAEYFTDENRESKWRLK